jgi:hypothetical protein
MGQHMATRTPMFTDLAHFPLSQQIIELPTISTGKETKMTANYRVSISAKSGKVTTIVGNDQHITIEKHQVKRDERPEASASTTPSVSGQDQDIVQPIGRNAKVIVNGKRIK